VLTIGVGARRLGRSCPGGPDVDHLPPGPAIAPYLLPAALPDPLADGPQTLEFLPAEPRETTRRRLRDRAA
jgi:hypothetical protein